MSEQQSSYRQILKSTSILGGVQIFNILLSILRSKFIAIFLGPVGMGISGLFTGALSLITNLTNFGLGISAVRDVAAAHASNDEEKIKRVITVFRKAVWITGLLGVITVLGLSKWLSLWTFGSSKYTWAFIWLSITLLFSQLTSGQDVLLQGMRKMQHLAKANMAGSFTSLIVSIPVYYYLGINGIVPALILTGALTTIVTWHFARQVKTGYTKISFTESIKESKSMMKMGLMLSFSYLITLAVSYLIRIFVSRSGGVADVGFYNAGFAIISSYVGLVFTAMATEYFPRLAGVAQDNKISTELINTQAEISIVILSPILCTFLIFINWVVVLLYTNKFSPVNGLLHWAALGIYFKAVSWSMAFIFIAKGDSKIYFWNELIFNFYMLIGSILGYKYYGLEGLGVSFMVIYILYSLQVFFLTKKKYSFAFNRSFWKVFSVQISLGVSSFLTIRYIKHPYSYLLGFIIILSSTAFSFFELNRRVDFRSALNKIK